MSSNQSSSKHSSQRRYTPELRERAVRMVEAAIAENGERFGAVSRVAHQLGVGPESVRNWVKQAEIDKGERPGLTTEERRRLVELERENRELRRANETSGARRPFFAAELDGRRPTSEVTRYVDAHKDQYGVEPICRVLEIMPTPGLWRVRIEVVRSA